MKRAPHPVVWTVLYLPFGALGGFISVALTFLATQHGLSISEGALINGAQMLMNWLKWLWAPVVDVTLTPRRWYVVATSVSAIGIFAMSAVPLGPDTLPLLLAIIAGASLVNSMVGMAVEAIMASCTPPEEIGRTSAWFQVGNLGGAGVGGGLGLLLVTKLPKPWMAGAIMGTVFLLCCLALLLTPAVKAHHAGESAKGRIASVARDLWQMLKTKGGLLSAIVCVLPIGTGAAQAVLTQAKVAAFWGAGAEHVELVQGVVSGIVTSVGCFAGGYVCQRFEARRAYAGIGVLLAFVALGMALTPASVATYVVWNLVYAFSVGLAYAAFTAVVLSAIGAGSGATKYNVFASLSNFPIWWLGLAPGLAAEKWGARAMLLAEAAAGVVGVVIFTAAQARVRRSELAEA